MRSGDRWLTLFPEIFLFDYNESGGITGIIFKHFLHRYPDISKLITPKVFNCNILFHFTILVKIVL